MIDLSQIRNRASYWLASAMLLVAISANAQIKGQVIDAQGQGAIPECNVYLAGYTLGTTTNSNGYFELNGVPNGVYELVFSHVSYQKYIQVVTVNNEEVKLKVQLGEEVRELETFVVRDGKVRGKRRRDLKNFKEFFYGDKYNENLISIVNEDVLDFKREQGVTTAADDYSLYITNDHLGYEISYYLKDYLYSDKTKMQLGFPKFNPIFNENPVTEYYWMENRQRAYNGSSRHFFRALLQGDLDKAGFEAYLTRKDPEFDDEEAAKFYGDSDEKRPLNPKNLPMNFTIEDTEIKSIKKINFSDIIYVNYRYEYGSDGTYQNSQIKLMDSYVYVYTNGVVVNPNAIKLFGNMADEGVYSMLPYDFVSNDTLVLKDNKERVRLLNQVSDLAKEKLTEKIYVHTNRDDYDQGETMWFKTYAVAGPNHQPSPLSIKTFVELIKGDSVYRSIILEAQEGMTSGSFDIPEEAPIGNYVLRAYTNWMKNESTDYFFKKSILINDRKLTYQTNTIRETTVSKDIDLQFFPESGNLVDGTEQNIAFKAINSKGLPQEIEGQIWSNKGELISTFESMHDGMGSVTFTPKKGESYRAMVKGFNQEFELPKERSQHLLHIDALSDSSNFKLEIIGKRSADEELFLIAQSRGWLNYTLQFELVNGQKTINIPSSSLNEGIVHFTIFNDEGRPVAERLAFNDKNERVNIKLTSTKDTYDPREGSSIEIEATDNQGNPVSGYFSLSAINLTSVQTKPSLRNIATAFLITSDLKGYVHQPEYYFDHESVNRMAHLDLVMMTHGWSRFNWNTIDDKIKEEYSFAYDEGIDVQGRMFVQGRRKGVKRGFVTYVSNKEDNPQTEFVNTDRKGNFFLEQVNPKGQEPVMLKGMTKKGNNYVRFEIDSTISYPSITSSHIKPFLRSDLSILSAERRDYFQTNKELEELNASLNAQVVDSLPNLKEARKSIYGQPSASYKFDDFVQGSKSNSVFSYMQGRIPGLLITPNGPIIRGTQDNPFDNFQLGNSASDTLSTEQNGGSPLIDDSNLPLIFLDNTKVDYVGVSSLPVDIVERVDIYKGPDAIVFGTGAVSGAIMIFTRMDMADRLAQFNGAYSIKVKGFHQAREFYQPKYGNPELNFGPDHRKTLHWEPYIMTDENGKATVKFYNSDDLSEVLLRVEGISTSGQPGAATYYYKMNGSQLNEQSKTNLTRTNNF